jgi:hypothetical protein
MSRNVRSGKVVGTESSRQTAYDDMRASPGIGLDADGNVIFDGEAEAMGHAMAEPQGAATRVSIPGRSRARPR